MTPNRYPVSSAVEAQAAALRLLTNPPPGVDPVAGMAAAERIVVVTHLCRGLAVAPAYYWARPLGRLLEALAPDFPADWQLVPEALLTPSGWAWFNPPLTLPIAGQSPLSLAAVLWGPPARAGAGDGQLGAPVGFAVWFGSPHSGPPLPWVLFDWRHGETLAAITAQVTAEYPDADDAPALAAALRLLAAGLALASQELLAAPAQPLERHARKRLVAARELPLPAEPTVRVVELRRRAVAGPAPHGGREDQAAVEWSCQWLVRGHWRRQPYPSRGVVQPIWIHAYVKGPADKELRPPRATLFAVVR